MDKYKYSELTGRIIKCAMEVNSFLGIGFPEVIYQRALALELEKAGIKFQQEIEVAVYYKDYPEPIGKRRVDFLVEGLVLVELKALTEITDAHTCQVLNYLNAFKIEVGLLLNFGEQSLKPRRFVMDH